MGNKSTKASMDPLTADQLAQGNDGQVYALRKRHAGCTGMFWRQDPTNRTTVLRGQADWPRDGARLRGNVVKDKQGEAWLVTTHVQQKGRPWKIAPAGSALPFEYNNHYFLELEGNQS